MNRALRFLLAVISTTVLFAQPVEQTGFEGQADETVFNEASWASQGFSVPWTDGFDQSRAHVDNAFAHSGSTSLRVFFPAGQFGPPNSGGQAPLIVPAASQYYISYWLRFSDTFSWGNTSQGGKLPGLAGGSRCSGCAVCTGTNGFSARLMWRENGRAILYLYHMDKAGTCGDQINLQLTSGVNFYFQREQWYQVIERVKVNTGNNFDGEVQLWINQQPALQVTGIRFVNNGNQVDNLYFSTFHGGSTSDWAPTVDSYIWFDDVMITTNANDIFIPLSLDESDANNSLQLENGATLFPQPLVSGQSFSLKGVSGLEENCTLEWIDLRGILKATSPELDVPALMSGFYFLKIHTADRTVCMKVRVE